MLALAAAAFVAYQQWLSLALWTGIQIPPFFDDSYSYVLGIRRVAETGRLLPDVPYPARWAQFLYHSYNHILGSVALVFDVSPAKVYEASFFAGKLLLLLVLLKLLATLERDELVRAAVLVSAAFYSGGLGFHGFFWVVPSFWMLCVFLLLTSEPLARSATHPLALLALGALLASLHPLGVYLYVLLTAWDLGVTLLERPQQWTRSLRRLGAVGAGVALVLALQFLPGARPGPEVSTSRSRLAAAADAGNVPSEAFTRPGGGWPDRGRQTAGTWFPGLDGVVSSYFAIVFEFPRSVALAGALVLLGWGRRFRLLLLFFLSLAFTLASTLHPRAFRSLLILWPVTILVLGTAPALAWRLLGPRIRFSAVRGLLAGGAVAALVAQPAAWIIWTRRVIIPEATRYSALHWDEGCAGRLLAVTDAATDPIYYGSKYASFAFLATGTYERFALPLHLLKPERRELDGDTPRWVVLDGEWQREEPWASSQRDFRARAARAPGVEVESFNCGAFEVLRLARSPE